MTMMGTRKERGEEAICGNDEIDNESKRIKEENKLLPMK